MSDVGDELDRLVRRKLSRDLKKEGRKCHHANYEELAEHRCAEFAQYLFHVIENADFEFYEDC